MRTFLAILRFELRLHLASPLSWTLMAVYFAIHLMTIAGIGIHINDNLLIHINSPFMIVRTELVLNVFSLVPVIYFVVSAATRDEERGTVSLFFTTPVNKLSLLLGRFSAGALMSVLAGVVGLCGTLAGTFVPGLEASRIGPFAWQPYAFSLVALVGPNILVFCALFFSVAALTRSVALTFGSALALMVLEVALNTSAEASASVPNWLVLADPFGALAVNEAGRYWTISELNTRLPVALLPANRVLWLALGALTLAVTWWRFRLELSIGRTGTRQSSRLIEHARAAARLATRQPRATDLPIMSRRPDAAATGAVRLSSLLQFASQVRMDLRGVVLSPLFWLVLLLAVFGTISDVQSASSGLDVPLYPTTGRMLTVFSFSLIAFVLLLLIYYSSALVHREQECGVAEMTASAPYPDWIMVASKTTALCLVISLLLITSMLTSVTIQAVSGYRPFELGLYLEGLFVYEGFYFWMLAVLAVFVQVLSPGKWSGMLLVLIVFVGLLALEPLGFEHVLYGFRIPRVVYSDMNGFGHFRAFTHWLIAYWSAGCVLLLVLGHLFYRRGHYARAAERMRDARLRLTRRTAASAVAALALFAGVGGWIFYNTNILHRYQDAEDRGRAKADYERAYGAYSNADAPSIQDLAMEVDLYPEERRLESRGTATLRNNKNRPIAEFVVSVDPRNQVHSLRADPAVRSRQDVAQGFYLFTPETPLRPGQSVTLSWNLTRNNQGFVNAEADNEVIENGTYVTSASIMPVPGYDETRELLEPALRREQGLPAKAALPALGDPTQLDKLRYGVDGRAGVKVTFSTAADQTPVSSGVLRRQWEQNGRRYFEYVLERPIWPAVPLLSARYTTARDTWDGVSLEVYHDAKHPWNVGAMLETAKKSMAYLSREFGRYPLSHFRIAEYAQYRGAAQAGPGVIAYSESVGFLSDLRNGAALDYATIHELAHQWWGGMVYGARMQGRQILNETMAQYSTFMVFKEYEDPKWLRGLLGSTLDNYLRLRSGDTAAEQPLLLTVDQGNISYNKGALVMFALQEIIGADRLHQGLRNFLEKFAFKDAPFPTSRDFVNELRAVAGPEHQALITDLFEKIVLYDVRVDAARVRPVNGEFEVAVDISARQFESNGLGVETEVPLEAPFTIAVFPDSPRPLDEQTPLYTDRRVLTTGTQTLVVRVPEKPGAVGVDPFHLMIDRTPSNNVFVLRE